MVDFSGIQGTEPKQSLIIDPGPHGCPYQNYTADVATIKSGHATVVTGGGSVGNSLSLCGALHGSVATNDWPILVDIDPRHKQKPDDWDKATALPDLANVPRGFKPKWGAKVWMLGSTLTAAYGETLVHAANGLITNTGDPDGTVHAVSVFGYKCLKAVTSGTWVAVEALGLISIDDTA